MMSQNRRVPNFFSYQVELNPKTSEIVCKGAGTAKADLHNEARFSHTFADQVRNYKWKGIQYLTYIIYI